MASQSGWITSLARAPTGAMRSSGMLTSTLVLTGPLPISLAKLVCTGAAVHAGVHHQGVEPVGVVDRRDHQQLLELGILEIVPRRRRGPALLLEGLGVDHEAGAGLADRDRLVVLEQRGRIELALVEPL